MFRSFETINHVIYTVLACNEEFESEGHFHSVGKTVMTLRLEAYRPLDIINFQKGSVWRKLFSFLNVLLLSIMAKKTL